MWRCALFYGWIWWGCEPSLSHFQRVPDTPSGHMYHHALTCMEMATPSRSTKVKHWRLWKPITLTQPVLHLAIRSTTTRHLQRSSRRICRMHSYDLHDQMTHRTASFAQYNGFH
eukprot:5208550-Amphidinium_carterae.1